MTNQTSIEPPVQPILENLWWVIPGKLAGVRKPIAMTHLLIRLSQAQVRELEVAHLEELSEALLDFEDVENLTDWLRNLERESQVE